MVRDAFFLKESCAFMLPASPAPAFGIALQTFSATQFAWAQAINTAAIHASMPRNMSLLGPRGVHAWLDQRAYRHYRVSMTHKMKADALYAYNSMRIQPSLAR